MTDQKPPLPSAANDYVKPVLRPRTDAEREACSVVVRARVEQYRSAKRASDALSPPQGGAAPDLAS
ncbi:MAG: hypothetical protein AB7I35_01260 [Ramlibacter sp.]